MSKTRRAPRRREPAAVTIGNLELQLKNAQQRCETLMKERDGYYREVREAHARISELSGQASQVSAERAEFAHRLEECQAKLASTEQRFDGYRQAIEDMLPYPA